jgi:hyperosmotically inducible protein
MIEKRLMLGGLALAAVLVAPLAAAEERDDNELKTKMEARLGHDPQLRDNRVEVIVEDGVLRLEGKVDNASEKSRATRLAVSAGAKRIENNLELELPAAGQDSNGLTEKAKATARAAGNEVSDTWITSKIKTELLLDKNLKGSNIGVSTSQNGVVTMTGTVASELGHRRAVEAARAIEGVREVKDELRVTAPQP